MADPRDDGTPRFRLATVRVRTWGKFCQGYRVFEECPFLDRAGLGTACRADGTKLQEQPNNHHRAFRSAACLASDEGPPDHDRTPEEAIAHDFGSQP